MEYFGVQFHGKSVLRRWEMLDEFHKISIILTKTRRNDECMLETYTITVIAKKKMKARTSMLPFPFHVHDLFLANFHRVQEAI